MELGRRLQCLGLKKGNEVDVEQIQWLYKQYFAGDCSVSCYAFMCEFIHFEGLWLRV